MEDIIKTRELSRAFGRRQVVRDLTLSVPEGSIFALIGPNGAGKTTSIKTLVNILEPSSGEATILGTRSTKLGPAQFQQIGYVSENQELLDWMTVGELLAYCKPMYPNWDDVFCTSLLRQLDLDPKQRINSLSRGMKVKTALLSSLAYHPRLLILDEPFAGLDALVREEFIRGILELTGQDRWTVLMASHEIDEVERLADWIGILNKGRLELCESVTSLQARFRQIEVRVSDDVPLPSHLPASWLLAEKAALRLQFVETRYDPMETDKALRQMFPMSQQVVATPMSLLSKSLFILLVLVLPSLIAEVIVLRANGISVSETLSVLPQEIILPSALFLVPPMLVAALTSSLTRLLVIGVASVTAFFLIHYAVLASVMTFGTGPGRRVNAVFPGQWPLIFSNNPSATIVSAILAVVLGVIVIAYQYLKRRTLHSGAAAVLGMCLIIGNLNIWSWNLLKSGDWLSAQSGLDPRTVKLMVTKGPGAGFVTENGGKLMILRPIEIQGVPPDFFLEVIGHRAVVEFSDGKSVSSSLDYPWGFFSDRAVGGGLQLQVEQDVRVLNDPSPVKGPMAAPLLSLDIDTYQKYKEIPGTLSAEAQLKVYQRLTATLPLKVGSSHRSELGELTLLSVAPNQNTFLTVLSNSKRDGFIVTLRESGVRYWLQRTSLSGALYVLRNRARKEALFGRPYPKDIFGKFPAQHRLVVSRSPIYFTTAGIPNYQGPVIDEEWLQQAELLRVDTRVVGQFSTSARADNFVMNAR